MLAKFSPRRYTRNLRMNTAAVFVSLRMEVPALEPPRMPFRQPGAESVCSSTGQPQGQKHEVENGL